MIVINSYGGCGSKYLAKQIFKNIESQNYHSLHRHIRYPDTLIGTDVKKVILVIGNPIDVIKSFFWRQHKNTTQHGFNNLEGPGCWNWPLQHYKNIGGCFENFSEHWGLSEYLDNGVDLFKLEEFVDNWHNENSHFQFDFMMIHYEDIYKSQESIFEFLERDLKIKFDPFKSRTSSSLVINGRLEELLKEIYGSLETKLENLPTKLIYNSNRDA